MKLHLAENLALPAEAVTRTFGILAVRGAGKSNTAAVMAEEMFGAGLPFVAVDPVGSWWGLRSSGDGTAPGLPIPIFGGKHGDIPLERGAGDLVADLVVEKRLSCVLDLSGFDSEGDKKTFLLAFARRLYHRNENPLHLFLEEADDYIPQKPMRDEAQLLRAWENIVRRGRGRGLGMTLITQRSAALNKMVLTQVETLIAMRTTGPQDQKAIEAWIQYHQQSRDVMESLASLEDGEAWIWSPHFLKAMVRVQVRRRRTFDSGATPTNVKATAARPPATLADVDLAALQQKMAATIEKAKADDPRELRQRIAALQRELASAKCEKPAVPPKVERIEVPVLGNEDRRLVATLMSRIESLRAETQDTFERFGAEVMRSLDAKLRSLPSAREQLRQSPQRGPGERAVPPATARRPPARAATSDRKVSIDTSSDLTGPEQRIVDAIAWLEAIGVTEPEQPAVAFLAGYTWGGGAFNNPRGALRTRGLVEYLGSERIRLTDAGRALAQAPGAPLTTEDLHERVLERLPGPEQRLLRPLLDAYPRALSNEDLAKRAGYTPNAGAFNNPRGRLRSLGLIEYPQPGYVVARPLLFLD